MFWNIVLRHVNLFTSEKYDGYSFFCLMSCVRKICLFCLSLFISPRMIRTFYRLCLERGKIAHGRRCLISVSSQALVGL